MNFHIGQKVVCIDASRGVLPDRVPLVVGQIYTIAAKSSAYTEAAVQIEEIATPGEWYRARRFRPVAERKTDISVFTSLLNKQPEKVI